MVVAVVLIVIVIVVVVLILPSYLEFIMHFQLHQHRQHINGEGIGGVVQVMPYKEDGWMDGILKKK